jgi:serine/threonine-protein kinase
VTALGRRCVVCRETYAGDERFCPRDGGAIVDADGGEAADPRVGRTVDGRYVIRRVLGRGGMGTVYAADHVGLDRSVAIKLATWGDADDTARARFRREARAASRVAHPGVVAVLDFGSWDDADYLVMELVAGRTLASALHDGPLPVARAVAITRALLDALAAIHAAGIVHRDVKPGNVMLGDGDVVKLMDFGIAKTAGGATLTRGDHAVGTPAFMAPEQLLGDDVDGRADLYAVGVTLFAMLVGDVPFGETSFTRVAMRHLDAPPPLDALPAEVPAPVVAALRRVLAKAPADRFADAAAFAAALAGDAVASPPPAPVTGGDGMATVADRPSAVRPPEVAAAPRRTRLAAVVALVVPVVAVVAYFAYDTVDRPAAVPGDAAVARPDAAVVPRDAAVATVADDQLRLARDAEDRGDLELAIAAYREAYAARPGADALYRIADLEDRLGKRPDAARDFRRYLDAAPAAADRARVTARIAALEAPAAVAAPGRAAVATPAAKHHCLCGIVPPDHVAWQGACARVSALGACHCITDDGGQLCLDRVVGSADSSDGFRCPRELEPGQAGAACRAFDNGRPPTNEVVQGHYECTYCTGNDFAFEGNEGDACIGYDHKTGVRQRGVLHACE